MGQLRIKTAKSRFYLRPFRLRVHNDSTESYRETFTKTWQKANPSSQYACLNANLVSRPGRLRKLRLLTGQPR